MRLGVRVASAAVLIGVLVAALWEGGVAVDVVVGVAVALGLYEYSDLMRRAGASPYALVLYPLGALLLYRFLYPVQFPALEWGLGAAVVVGLLVGLLQTGPSVTRWAAAVGGALYIGLTVGYYLALLRWRQPDPDHHGLRIVVVVLAAAMVGDTVALLAGTAFGRHRFFPSISPRKSVEGALAGAAASVAVVALVGPALLPLGHGDGVVLGALVAVAAQGGDLVESRLKRTAGVKDSGTLIPGHGGMLDRMDSLLLLGPVVYCYLRLIALP